MKKKIFSVIGVAVFAVAVAFNINTNLTNSAKMDVTLTKLETLVMGECSASASGCSASCSGSMYCISDSRSVNCDGNHSSC